MQGGNEVVCHIVYGVEIGVITLKNATYVLPETLDRPNVLPNVICMGIPTRPTTSWNPSSKSQMHTLQTFFDRVDLASKQEVTV